MTEFQDRIRITTGGGGYLAQLMLGLDVNISGDLAINNGGIATGLNHSQTTIAGPGGVFSFAGSAAGAGTNSITYARYPINFPAPSAASAWSNSETASYLQPGVNQIVTGVSPVSSSGTTLIQDSPEAMNAMTFDFTTPTGKEAWCAYLGSLISNAWNISIWGYPNIWAGTPIPFQQGDVLYPTNPVPNHTLSITLFAPTGNGNTLGIFGDPAGATGTQVLGTAVFAYNAATPAFTFVSWKPTKHGAITKTLPTNLGVPSSLNGMGANAVLKWSSTTPSKHLLKLLSKDDTAFMSAVLTAT